MVSTPRHLRGLVAVGLAIGLVAAACSSSSKPGLPGGNGNNGGNGGGSSLASGLSSNLDKLDSYQFSWQYSSSSSTATSADTGSFGTTGTVVNKPTPAYKINESGMIQIIVIGNQGWTSFDNGSSWMTSTDYNSTDSIKSLLPTQLYSSDFDTNANQFTIKGDESKNGVQCIHYQGNSTLGGLTGAVLGANYTFKSDLWVAKEGNYPVSGFYGWTASAGGQTGGFGYSFDVTHVNDAAANAVTAPTNVTALPSY